MATRFEEARQRYKAKSDEAKKAIASEPSRWKRFWKRVWFLISWPFRWLWAECHDWRFLVIFIIVFLALSSEVWVCYILGAVFWGTAFGNTMWAVGSACWLFWLGPGTPFMPICIGITIGIKALIDRIKERRKKHEDKPAVGDAQRLSE